jgi:hypothetical protein
MAFVGLDSVHDDAPHGAPFPHRQGTQAIEGRGRNTSRQLQGKGPVSVESCHAKGGRDVATASDDNYLYVWTETA